MQYKSVFGKQNVHAKNYAVFNFAKMRKSDEYENESERTKKANPAF